MEAMDPLRTRFLNIPLSAVLHPVSSAAQQIVQEQKRSAAVAPAVSEQELTAQQWFERGFAATDFDEKLRSYNEAIRLKPDFDQAFINRGNARCAQGDFEGAMKDYNEAIRSSRTMPRHSTTGALRGKPKATLREQTRILSKRSA
jgi:tetratricopeptide (TPR) repeat protein